MNQKTQITCTPGMFRSPLIPTAAVFLALGALCGLGALLCLPDPAYNQALMEKILRSGIRTASALKTWTYIHHAVALACFLCPAVTVWGILTVLRGQYARGLNFLSNAARALLRLVRIGWAAALVLFLYRAVTYVISILPRNDWPYQLLAAVLMEGLMLVQAACIYRALCRFLDDCDGSAASIGFSLASGRLEAGNISAFTATGFLILGILGVVLCFDRLFTLTIASDGFKQYYKLLTATHPGQWLCAASLLLGAVGDFLLGFYLKFFKRTAERAIFFANRKEIS